MRPICQITQIKNGYLVMLPPEENKFSRTQEQPQPVTIHCSDFADIVAAIQSQFPPSIAG